VSAHVAQIVCREHHSRPNLALNTHVHLQRSRASVIRCEERDWQTQLSSRIQEIAYEVRIGCAQVRWILGLIQLLKCSNRRSCCSDRNKSTCVWITAYPWPRSNRAGVGGHRLSHQVNAGIRGLIEGSSTQPQRTIKKNIVEDHVLIE